MNAIRFWSEGFCSMEYEEEERSREALCGFSVEQIFQLMNSRESGNHIIQCGSVSC